MNKDNIKVAVRIRPLNEKEVLIGCDHVVTVYGNQITVRDNKVDQDKKFGDGREPFKRFTFDVVFDSSKSVNSQEEVFNGLAIKLIDSVMSGFNNCIFAYGMTGTGKTHSLLGSKSDPGLIPRICEKMYKQLESNAESNIVCNELFISGLEIYNETLQDLLITDKTLKQRQKLKIRDSPTGDVVIQNLSTHPINHQNDISTLVNRFVSNRAIGATHINDQSSRSHAILTIYYQHVVLDSEAPQDFKSKFHLVDLAGSERSSLDSPIYSYERQREGSNINKSLMNLGTVIDALAKSCLKSDKTYYIPYRNSKLTWILKDSLGGNSLTTMIGTITPNGKFYNETIATLRFAKRTKEIKNSPIINEDPNVKLIRELREQIKILQNQLNSKQMPEDLLIKSQKVDEMSRNWTKQRKNSISYKKYSSTEEDGSYDADEGSITKGSQMQKINESKESLLQRENSRSSFEDLPFEDSLNESTSDNIIRSVNMLTVDKPAFNFQRKYYISSPSLLEETSKSDVQRISNDNLRVTQKSEKRYKSIGVSTELLGKDIEMKSSLHSLNDNRSLQRISHECLRNICPRSIMKSTIGESLPNLSISGYPSIVGMSSENSPIYPIPRGKSSIRFSLNTLSESSLSHVETDSLDGDATNSENKKVPRPPPGDFNKGQSESSDSIKHRIDNQGKKHKRKRIRQRRKSDKSRNESPTKKKIITTDHIVIDTDQCQQIELSTSDSNALSSSFEYVQENFYPTFYFESNPEISLPKDECINISKERSKKSIKTNLSNFISDDYEKFKKSDQLLTNFMDNKNKDNLENQEFVNMDVNKSRHNNINLINYLLTKQSTAKSPISRLGKLMKPVNNEVPEVIKKESSIKLNSLLSHSRANINQEFDIYCGSDISDTFDSRTESIESSEFESEFDMSEQMNIRITNYSRPENDDFTFTIEHRYDPIKSVKQIPSKALKKSSLVYGYLTKDSCEILNANYQRVKNSLNKILQQKKQITNQTEYTKLFLDQIKKDGYHGNRVESIFDLVNSVDEQNQENIVYKIMEYYNDTPNESDDDEDPLEYSEETRLIVCGSEIANVKQKLETIENVSKKLNDVLHEHTDDKNEVILDRHLVKELENLINIYGKEVEENNKGFLQKEETEIINDAYEILNHAMKTKKQTTNDILLKLSQEEANKLLEALRILKINTAIIKHIKENKNFENFNLEDAKEMRNIVNQTKDVDCDEKLLKSLKSIVSKSIGIHKNKSTIFELIEVIEKIENKGENNKMKCNEKETKMINEVLDTIEEADENSADIDTNNKICLEMTDMIEIHIKGKEEAIKNKENIESELQKSKCQTNKVNNKELLNNKITLQQNNEINCKDQNLKVRKDDAEKLSKLCKEFSESILPDSTVIRNVDIVDEIVDEVSKERKDGLENGTKLICDALEKGELENSKGKELVESLEIMKSLIPKSKAGEKERRFVEEIIDDLNRSLESGSKVKIDKSICEQLKAFGKKSEKRLDNSDEDSNKILEAIKCLFDDEECEQEKLLNRKDIDNLLDGIKVAKDALKNEISESKLIELEEILLKEVSEGKDLVKLKATVHEPLIGILCEAVEIQSSIPDIADRIRKSRQDEIENSRRPIETILKELVENSKNYQIKLKGQDLSKLSKVMDKIESKINETPDAERSNEWKANKILLDSVVPKLQEVIDCKSKELELKNVDPILEVSDCHSRPFSDFEDFIVPAVHVPVHSFGRPYLSISDSINEDLSHNLDYNQPIVDDREFVCSISSQCSQIEMITRSDDLADDVSLSFQSQLDPSIPEFEKSSEIGYYADSDVFSHFSSSDLPLFPPSNYQFMEEECNLNLDSLKPSNWMHIFEMELKYLEGQTDAFSSATDKNQEHFDIGCDHFFDNDKLFRVTENASLRLKNLENNCSNYVSNRRSSNASIPINATSRISSPFPDSDSPSHLFHLLDLLKRQNEIILSSSSLSRDDIEKQLQEHRNRISDVRSRLSRYNKFISSISTEKVYLDKKNSEDKQPPSIWRKYKEKHIIPLQSFRSQRTNLSPSNSTQSLYRKSNFDIQKSKKLLEETENIIRNSREKLNKK